MPPSFPRAAVPGAAVPTLPPPGPTWRTRLYGVLGLLMFGGAFVLSLTHVLPALVTDWQVRDAAEIVEPSSVRGGHCSARLLVHICDAELSASTKRGATTREVHYVFVDTASGDYGVSVMADPARPQLLTTDLGLERLWNRTLTLLAVWALLLALAFGSALTLRPARPDRVAG